MIPSERSATALVSAQFRIDRNFTVRTWSERAQAMLGWQAADVVGRELFACLGERGDLDAHEPLRAWQPVRFLSTKRHRDGSMVPVLVVFEPERDEQGTEQGVVILERLEPLGEAPAAEIEARYQSVVASMQEGVVVQGRDGSILGCNSAAERILGLSEGQLRGRTSIDPRWRTVHEDGTPFPGEQHPAMVVLRTGQPVLGVVMGVHRPEGDLAWIRINARPVRLTPTAPQHAVVVTFLDITEERRLLAELRHRSEQLALVIEGANDGFWDWDIPSGRVAYSQRWAQMLGYDHGELAADISTWEKLTHPDDMPAAKAALQAHFAGDTPFYECEFRMRHKRGDWVWILDRGKVVVRDAAGRPQRATGTHTDITARRATEERMRIVAQANEKLVEELRAALDRVKTLSGLLPVCAWCKSVRNDNGYWQRIEEYLAEHTDARMTHGLCPTCSGKVAP